MRLPIASPPKGAFCTSKYCAGPQHAGSLMAPLISLLSPQPLHGRGSSGCAVSASLGSSLRLPGFQQEAQVPAGDIPVRSSLLSPAYKRAAAFGAGRWGYSFQRGLSPTLNLAHPTNFLS